MPPLIGVTPCHSLDDYIESIKRVGADTRLLDFGAAPADAFQDLDGLLLTGDEDVDPARYGEALHPATGPINPRRDDFEVELITRAVAAGLPILGICRGVQVLNVACGGDLIQDISGQVPGALNHKATKQRIEIAHDVWVTRGSRLWTVLEERLGQDDVCPVNSRHHQSVRRLADHFEISATAPDGVIEAIERPSHPFCIGVQWHPENFWRTGEFRALFEAFIEACQRR
jgi:putative glutamine amidotransferase